MPYSLGRFRLTPAVTWLIGINVAVFLVFSLSGPEAQLTLARWFVLTPDALLRGEVWKVVTTTFFTNNFLAFLLDILVLWMFVPSLESQWGRRRFLTFFAVTSIAGNLVAALFGIVLGARAIFGMGPFIYAAIAAFGAEWGDAPVQFFGVLPMKARTLAIGITIVMVLSVLLNGDFAVGLGYLAAIAAGVAFVSSPRTWLLRLRRMRQKMKMRRYTVLRGGGGNDRRWMN